MKIKLNVSDHLARKLQELVDDEQITVVDTIEMAALWSILFGIATRDQRKRQLEAMAGRTGRGGRPV